MDRGAILGELRIESLAGEPSWGRPSKSDPSPTTENPNPRIVIALPWSIKRRGCERRIVVGAEEGQATNPDSVLIDLITTAHRALRLLTSGAAVSVAAAATMLNVDKDRVTRSLRLAFLAPDIAAAILEGRQPERLDTQTLYRTAHFPHDWAAQRRLLGFPPLS